MRANFSITPCKYVHIPCKLPLTLFFLEKSSISPSTWSISDALRCEKITDIWISIFHKSEYDLDLPLTLVSQINRHTILNGQHITRSWA